MMVKTPVRKGGTAPVELHQPQTPARKRAGWQTGSPLKGACVTSRLGIYAKFTELVCHQTIITNYIITSFGQPNTDII